jgi:hypothetical protein
MQLRRSLRLTAGALVLALPLLSSCGFSKATDRVYTPAAGVNNRGGQVDVLSAVVVSDQPDSGTFVATLSNESPTKPDTLESIEAAPHTSDNTTEVSDLEFGDVSSPVEVPARGYVNLADDEQGVTVTGGFTPGDFLHVRLTFSSGQTTDMKIPVVYACDEWEGLDTSAESASPAPTAAPYQCSAVLTESSEAAHG